MRTSRSSSVAARSPVSPGARRLADDEDRLARTVLARTREARSRRVPQLRDRARLADQHSRRRARDVTRECTAPVTRRDDVDARGGTERAARRPRPARRNGRALVSRRPRGIRAPQDPARRTGGSASRLGSMSFRTSPGATLETVPQPPAGTESVGFRAVPIHLRAEPGDYAEACLLPGDPLRAKYIAETFLDGRRAGERRARAPRVHGHTGRASRFPCREPAWAARARRSSSRSSSSSA